MTGKKNLSCAYESGNLERLVCFELLYGLPLSQL